MTRYRLLALTFLAGMTLACTVSKDQAPRPARKGAGTASQESAPPKPLPAPPAAVTSQPEIPPPADLSPEELRDIGVFRRSSASVVFITSIAMQRDFFSLDVTQIPRGTGSGFVWDKDGHIVTNYHVIQEGDRFSITLADHSEWEAKVVGSAPEKDLAVLQIKAPASRLSPIAVGSSRDLLVGQRVLAVGNPFGLDHTLTVGVVSALGRELRVEGNRTIRDVIQTDAAINPGNSGGPLLDSRGRLIGVNAQILSPSGTSAGIGFAIPVDTVKRLVPQLIAHGRTVLPGIGVSLLHDTYARQYQLQGAVVVEVSEGSPAARAGLIGFRRTNRGLVPGDQIIAVDGQPVAGGDDLAYAFENAGVGRTVRLTVVRGDQKRVVPVTLVDLR